MSIQNIYATGASPRTAQADGYSAGVSSSHAMAQRDLPYINRYKGVIERVGRSTGIDPALIAALISRESRGGTAVERTGGWGDNYNGFGLMQDNLSTGTELISCSTLKGIVRWLGNTTDASLNRDDGLLLVDKNWHQLQGEWNSEAHIRQGTGILTYMINAPQNPFQSPDQRLKAGIAAYNMGFQNMSRDYNSIDNHTTGGDYSNDVVARAQFFKHNGY